MENFLYDLVIIGGGINGVGIANDAAGRGLRVLLCEQGDLASATSSKSSKLIHGGLRYLEYYQFRLVKEALQEREILLKKAPHIIHPLQFILPHNKQLKPVWMLRLGLFLYDHLSKRQQLPSSHRIQLQNHSAGTILQKAFSQGFSYYDCWVDDARLVVLNAMQAKQFGATILTRTRCIAATNTTEAWQITLENTLKHTKSTVHAKALVNATGPWVDRTIQQVLGLNLKPHIIGIKGSHIVVPKLYPENYAFILTNSDDRVIFILPYLQAFSLIGTTEVAFNDDPNTAQISSEEIKYLCDAVNCYLQQPVSSHDVIWSFSGIRPLYNANEDVNNNTTSISRDYKLELSVVRNNLPLLSVFGGKITTYRKLAEHALDKLAPFFSTMGLPWTANIPLPGGNIFNHDISAFYSAFCQQYPWLPTQLALRYIQNYGCLAEEFLQQAKSLDDLGKNFGAGLYQSEVDYLIQQEWAQTTEDILWRRTKLGLFLSDQDSALLAQYLDIK
jgi:glycerol-3-phosphate dehydrogenase